MGLFQHFTGEPYTFLKLRTGSGGPTIVSEHNAFGVFKIRGGMTQVDNVETPTADASLQIRPSEAFVADLDADLVGHGIRVSRGSYGVLEYKIIGMVEGYDYDLKEIDFFALTLKRERISDWDESGSPLE